MTSRRHRLLIPEHSRPMATVHLALRSGTLHDPPEREGLAHLTGQMLLRGAGDLSQEQISEKLDYLGSYAGISVDRHLTSVTADALVRNLDALQELLQLTLTKPSFPEEEVQRLKRQRLAELAQIRDHDSSLGYRFYSRRLFAGHPYGRPGLGTETSVAAITRGDLVRFYEDRFSAHAALVAGCGDIDEARLIAFGEATLGGLRDDERESFDVGGIAPRDGWRALLIDKPERSQTQVFMGHPTVSAKHPEHLPLVLGNMVFGGTFTSRLSQEIREKRGWSYGVSSRVGADAHVGAVTMRFYPATEHTGDAITLAGDMFEEVARNGV
ncbi:MAG: pitrilysin family protein, partial [Myxococcota bacterium]|nr:pitrilysin family protein [Myxococcota bacterium]